MRKTQKMGDFSPPISSEATFATEAFSTLHAETFIRSDVAATTLKMKFLVNDIEVAVVDRPGMTTDAASQSPTTWAAGSSFTVTNHLSSIFSLIPGDGPSGRVLLSYYIQTTTDVKVGSIDLGAVTGTLRIKHNAAAGTTIQQYRFFTDTGSMYLKKVHKHIGRGTWANDNTTRGISGVSSAAVPNSEGVIPLRSGVVIKNKVGATLLAPALDKHDQFAASNLYFLDEDIQTFAAPSNFKIDGKSFTGVVGNTDYLSMSESALSGIFVAADRNALIEFSITPRNSLIVEEMYTVDSVYGCGNLSFHSAEKVGTVNTSFVSAMHGDNSAWAEWSYFIKRGYYGQH